MNCTSCGTTNPPNARFCSMCGEQLRTSGSRERRRVSVVFIDLTAFTTLTLGFDPEELRDLADEVLTVVAGVIEDYDGYVDAFRGDGLIALFGAPRSHPDDPQRAVLAAAAGLRAIESIGAAKGYPLKGRAGVNTGIVIAGAVGSGRVRDYTVMGSTVNLAARLEAAAIPGEVWVGPETFESTRHRLVYVESPPVRLAGFPNVRHAHRLVSTLEQHDVDPYDHLDFVGRDEELAKLRERLEFVRSMGKAHQLWLHGAAGSGKTRLLREFFRGASAQGARAVWVSGNSESTPWQQLGRQLLGLQDGEESRVRQQKAQQALSALLPGETRKFDRILASLEGGGGNGRGSTSARGRAVRVPAAWGEVIAAAARESEHGMLLALDTSSHDPQLLEMVELLAAVESPLLLIRTSRETEPAPGADSLLLEPLSPESSASLLGQLASAKLKVATESLVLQVSGVPAYIIELGRALSSTESGSFSGSLASLLQARLDLLSPAERQVLAMAALSGERTWERMLLDLAEGNGDERIRRLLREHLLVPDASPGIPGEVAYRFQSELLRHAVLRMIPFADRPILHFRIASWLEQHAPLALSELIGYHFREGGSAEAAYPHYLAAADHAASQGDPRYRTLFEDLLKLELPPELLAQGKLAYAQAALSLGDVEIAAAQLDGVKESIAGGEEMDELREAERNLRQDLESFKRREAAS